MRRKFVYFIFLTFLMYFLATKDASAVTISTVNIDKTSVALQESFQITAKITEGGANTSYFIKCRVGNNSSSLDEGQTLNSSEWLYDTGTWNEMPQVTLDDNGTWEGNITCRLKAKASVGNKLVYTRACPNNSGSCNSDKIFQSNDFSSITVVSSSPTPSTETTASPQPTASLPHTDEPTIDISPTSNLQLPTSNIYLSEVMIDPETGSKEWIEIYNGNGYETTLSDWYIDDVENGGSAPKKFSLTIQANSYDVYELSTSVFNNDGDKVRLLDPNQKELDSLEYQSSEKGKSLGRTSFKSDIFCLQESSKGKANNPCLNPTSTRSSQSGSSPKKTPTYTPKSSLFPTTKISTQKLTVKPTKNYFVSRNDPDFTDNMTKTAEDNVLGITTKEKGLGDSSTRALLSSLTFTSFAYSVLAVISIFYKIKMKMSHDIKTHLHPELT